jgi:hypothetical protein
VTRLEVHRPRRVSRNLRFALATVVTLSLAAPLTIALRSSGDGGAVPLLAFGAASAGILFVSLLVGNVGIRPRVQGQYLDVLTVIGRQSLDLAALTGVRWERAHGGTQSLRLRDQLTDVLITLPPPLPAREPIREGLTAAAQRGVLLPRRVTTIFSLPEMPGARRNKSYSYLPLVLVLLAFSACLGLVIGVLI